MGADAVRSGREVAIVTGAASGIGKAVAERLAQEGRHIAVVDFDRAKGEAVAREVAQRGVEAEFFPCDVSVSSQVEATVQAVVGRWGRIDILVNCAGIAGRSAPIWEQQDSDWETMLGVNLSGVFYFCRAVLPVMRAARYGRIVNVASIAGKEGNPNAVPYSATKAGVIGLTKAVAKEVAREGILVNSVAPAVIRTPILEQVSEEHLRYMLERIPMGRMGEPEEVASLIAWLCSRECSFSTGACYDISGGRATY